MKKKQLLCCSNVTFHILLTINQGVCLVLADSKLSISDTNFPQQIMFPIQGWKALDIKIIKVWPQLKAEVRIWWEKVKSFFKMFEKGKVSRFQSREYEPRVKYIKLLGWRVRRQQRPGTKLRWKNSWKTMEYNIFNLCVLMKREIELNWINFEADLHPADKLGKLIMQLILEIGQ